MHTVLEPKIMSKNYFYFQRLANSTNLNIPKLVSPNSPNFKIQNMDLFFEQNLGFLNSVRDFR